MLRPSLKRRMSPRAMARLGGSFHPSMKFMPLTRWTRRSPARPVPYSFDERESADDAVGEKLFGFGANDGADALRTDLHDATGFFCGGDHRHAIGGGMGHGLFAVDVFAGADGVDDDLFVPMVGDGGDEAVDFLVVEKIFVAARGGNFFADNFLGERVAAVVEVASGDAFDAGKLDGIAKQAGTLHADADDAEAQAVARRSRLQRQRNVLRFKKNGGRSRERAGSSSGALEELTAGKIFFHGCLQESVFPANMNII